MRTLSRLARAIGIAVVLLVVLAALPAALVVIQRSVQLSWRDIGAQWLSPGGAVVAAIGLGWALWASVLWTLIGDVIRTLRGAPKRLPVPLHAAVTAAAGGILLAVQAIRGATVPAAGDRPAPPPVPATTPSLPSAPALPSPAPDPATSPAGVRLPGGWLPLPVAAAVGATVAAVWARRRHQYAPQPPGGWRRDDPDLPAPGSPVHRLLHALPDPDPDPDPDSDPAAAAAAAAGPARGAHIRTGASWSPRTVLAAGPVHLVGPGRDDGARGLLVALAAQPAAVRLELTADVRAAVLGLGPAAWVPTVPAGGSAAPRTGAPGVPPVPRTTGPSEGPAGQARPPAAQLVQFLIPDGPAGRGEPSDPDADSADPISCTVRLAATAAGSCWSVAADGTVTAITGPAPPIGRLPMLDQATAVAILTSLDLLAPPRAAAPPHAVRPRPLPGSAAALTGWPDPPPAPSGEPGRLLVQVLGEPAVLRPHGDGSHQPVPIRRGASRQLLVLLALNRGGIGADQLQEALWPDTTRSPAYHNFHTAMSALRHTLQDAAGRPVLRQDDPAGAPPGQRSYWLDPAAVQVDLWRLQDLCDAADTTTNPHRRRALLQAAADVPGGELAAGWRHGWLSTDREHVARHLLDLYTHLADTEPDHDTALHLLHRAAALAPANQAVHRRILHRHAAAGDHHGLHRAITTLTGNLTAAGQPPEPATTDLITSLQTGTGQQACPPPEPAHGGPSGATPWSPR
ncbi:hypothetical protein [Dactylosporangium sp. CA-092794]|uniref:hypothetical protein n=1 Tax=Dactylosporangium sp. CA-092794 TaxID=3239929 RepID=UPI003D8ED3B7